MSDNNNPDPPMIFVGVLILVIAVALLGAIMSDLDQDSVGDAFLVLVLCALFFGGAFIAISRLPL